MPASFFDYDRDGWLDLFAGNYLSYTLESHTQCYDRAGAPDYCPPETSRPHPDVLYRNRGDGSFEDVTAAAGLGREFGLVLMATRFYDAAAAAFATPCYWDAGYNQTGPWFENATIVDTGTGIQTNNYWGDIWVTPSDRRYPNASLSYVTGSHNFKVGMQWSFGNDGDTRNGRATSTCGRATGCRSRATPTSRYRARIATTLPPTTTRRAGTPRCGRIAASTCRTRGRSTD